MLLLLGSTLAKFHQRFGTDKTAELIPPALTERALKAISQYVIIDAMPTTQIDPSKFICFHW
jgi:hypothetical protein